MKILEAKGTRDFPAEQAIARQKLVSTLKRVFELYGYNPIENPILQSFETLTSKYAGGAEILKEIFKLKDQGGRELALRYDLTVPMCIFLAQNPNMKLPFKSYRTGEVFRDGPIKLGRYRQFTQCDWDVVGVKGMRADSEALSIVQKSFNEIGLKVKISVNNRKLLNGILETAGIKKEMLETTILSIDKLEKIGESGVEKELIQKGISESSVKKLMELVRIKGDNIEKVELLRSEVDNEEGKQGLAEIDELITNLEDDSSVFFDPSLARGLSYYTGTVFEVFLIDSEITAAVCGGGRYDEIIGNFIGSKEFPAVGGSFGIDVILEAIKLKKAVAQEKSVAQAYVIPINVGKKGIGIAESLREEGIKTDIDLLGRAIGKSLEYANSMGIPFAIFVGEKELSEGKIKLRDLQDGKEEMVSIKQAAAIIKEKNK